MKKVLLVPPKNWTANDTAELRKALNGTGEHVAVGSDPGTANWYDFALILPVAEYGPGFLRNFGQRIADRSKLVYVDRDIPTIARKIESLVNPKVEEEHA